MSEQYPRKLWDDPAFHKGREYGRMEQEATINFALEQAGAPSIRTLLQSLAGGFKIVITKDIGEWPYE